MIINLDSIPIYWTTCDKSKDRWPLMDQMLDSLSVSGEKIVGPITPHYAVGVALGYLEALKKCEPPFLVLEDDATLMQSLSSMGSIEVPDDADALYLGTTLSGRVKGVTLQRTVIAAHVDDKIMRVFNMLGFHAIVYTSKTYVQRCIEILENYLSNPVGGCDDPIAENMWRHNVYSLKSPMFYQKDGRNDAITKIPIDILL